MDDDYDDYDDNDDGNDNDYDIDINMIPMTVVSV